jgi:hypothetical protein
MTSLIVMVMAIAVAGLLFGMMLRAFRSASARRAHGDGGDVSWMTSPSSFGDSGSSDCSSADGGAGCDGGGGGGSD